MSGKSGMKKNGNALRLGRRHSKTDVRTQFAALCYRRRRKNKFEVLLITGRKSGRWKLPKGWPVNGLTPAEAAMKEAYEEAGVLGTCHDECIGHYCYAKSLRKPHKTLPCIVAVFPVRCTGIADIYPETGERNRVWLTPKKATKLVSEPSLKSILENFDPVRLDN